jgi:hypothetical protein
MLNLASNLTKPSSRPEHDVQCEPVVAGGRRAGASDSEAACHTGREATLGRGREGGYGLHVGALEAMEERR